MGRQYILIVDDDPHFELRRELMVRGDFQVLYARNVEQAQHFAKTVPEIRFGVLDIRIPDYAPYETDETDDGGLAGVRLHRDLQDTLPGARFIFKTNYRDTRRIVGMVRERPSVYPPYVVSGSVSTQMILNRAKDAYNDGRLHPWVLIVHGHKRDAVSTLKNVLKDRFGITDVHVLRDLPGQNMAIIEKFEHYARRADLVFALMTDDDKAGEELMRARQNVIFEIGYFYSALLRKSGHVILLEIRGIEIPSDMKGIGTINISEGVDTPAVLKDLDRELAPLGIKPLGPS